MTTYSPPTNADSDSHNALRAQNEALVILIIVMSIVITILFLCVCLMYVTRNKRDELLKFKLSNMHNNLDVVGLHMKSKSQSQTQTRKGIEIAQAIDIYSVEGGTNGAHMQPRNVDVNTGQNDTLQLQLHDDPGSSHDQCSIHFKDDSIDTGNHNFRNNYSTNQENNGESASDEELYMHVEQTIGGDEIDIILEKQTKNGYVNDKNNGNDLPPNQLDWNKDDQGGHYSKNGSELPSMPQGHSQIGLEGVTGETGL